DDVTYPTTNIPVANGFLCFFRGNRASAAYGTETSPLYVPQTVTLNATGSINYGNITVSDWFTPGSSNLSYTSASPFAGYSLVGNPYPSSIDWDTFQRTSLATGGIYGTATVSKTIYVLDPQSHNFGAYISGNAGLGGTNHATNIIVSGQGFFVVATGTSPVQPQLTFTETAKTTTQNTGVSLLMGTPVNQANNQFLKLRLEKDTVNADETIITFNNQASNKYNPDLDASYKSGYGVVSLAGISQDNIKVAIHAMPLPKLQAENLGLNVTANATGIYSLTLKDIVAVPRLYDIWLMDKYSKDSLDMRQNLTYNFNIYKNDTASFGANRFTLMIRQNPAYAYRLLNFAASKVPDVRQVQVNWNTINEGNYTNFTVEHSIDGGKTYSTLNSLIASGAGKYGFLDKSPAEGQNLYRLKQEDINNTITYSNIVTIQFSYQNSSLVNNNLMIYPNPGVSNITLTMTAQTTNAAGYQIKFMNSSGIVVKQATSDQPTWLGNVSNLQPGTYVIQVLNSKNETLVGETKFVKM
ncbi:MAG: T9SS type A sorting domain-containing protein, partial [Mucilaginibacter sp.]